MILIQTIILTMYICLCKAVTERQIKESVNNGATSYAEVRRRLGVSSQCGKCFQQAKAIIRNEVGKKAEFEAVA